ncbi:Ribokinase-like protein [Atractiella rhizophila]|nr:Ribokinase-like protein [Atractiella rhizophila]
MTSQILILGSCSLDLVSYVPHFPSAGETLSCTSFLQNLGGKGSNQAVAASLLSPSSTSVSFIGAVGSDAYAPLVLEGLRKNGVDVSNVKRTEGDTGLAIIWVEEKTGENRIVIVPGANASVDHASYLQNSGLNPSENQAGSTFLLTQLEIPLNVVIDANIHASKKGITTIFNPAPAPSSSKAQEFTDIFYSSIDYLVLNEVEALQLSTSSHSTSPDHPSQSTMKAESDLSLLPLSSLADFAIPLLARGIRKAVILTLGARGAIYVPSSPPQHDASKQSNGSKYVHVKAKRYRPPGTEEWKQVVDTTAAGDCFIGAFAGAVGRGWSDVEAVEWACKASAISVGRKGAGGSIPSLREVEEGEWEDL